jgi:hypothetical protein
MEEILRTNDPVRLSFAQHLLDEAGIPSFVADTHISNTEGNIFLFPRRLMVASDRLAAARLALREMPPE